VIQREIVEIVLRHATRREAALDAGTHTAAVEPIGAANGVVRAFAIARCNDESANGGGTASAVTSFTMAATCFFVAATLPPSMIASSTRLLAAQVRKSLVVMSLARDAAEIGVASAESIEWRTPMRSAPAIRA
jgi:hypothetical protein